ncbi:pyridoxamine 5'-phosphate oxidase family protein [uncultured Deinococcus sp.]|uniref:pyridoxamine 5'-phosphate oxidase family protein n=1 Tax=uncultured Deinococcus sp. TaxID=158789 RepID=UPI00338FDDE2
MYFVGMAAADGRVNLSPKGLDSLRVLGPGRVAWLNVTGSGNETAAHILQPPRMTLMFCAFEGPPLILRLYGQARMVQPDAPYRAQRADLFPALPGARQVFVLDLDFVQTSCGMAMPRLPGAARRIKCLGRAQDPRRTRYLPAAQEQREHRRFSYRSAWRRAAQDSRLRRDGWTGGARMPILGMLPARRRVFTSEKNPPRRALGAARVSPRRGRLRKE